MKFPELTHLQFFVLVLVSKGPHSGRFIRERLAELGETQSPAAFYQFMSRLEEKGVLSGWYESCHLDGQTIKERKYETTKSGIKAIRRSQQFYGIVSDIATPHEGKGAYIFSGGFDVEKEDRQ